MSLLKRSMRLVCGNLTALIWYNRVVLLKDKEEKELVNFLLNIILLVYSFMY